MIDLSTGEVVDDREQILMRLRQAGTEGDPLYLVRHEIQIMAYAARCDGHYTEIEQDIIADFVSLRCGHVREYEAWMRHAASLWPDRWSFDRSLSSVAQDGQEELRPFLRALRRIVHSDGILAEQEFNIMLQLEQAIR